MSAALPYPAAGAPRPTGVVSTNPARCRDCYRCVRICPVEAVRVRNGQAEVVSELCIGCASCVRACPQKAKVVWDGLASVKAAVAAGRTVIASVAPSAPAYFPMSGADQMESALRSLGFAAVHETSVAAEWVGEAHAAVIAQGATRRPVIASACPVVVNLVEQYYPDLLPRLAPVVSPMIAHGRYLRQLYGRSAFIVFIGPCVAKKGEAARPELAGAIDAAMTYAELESWLAEEGIAFPVESAAGVAAGAAVAGNSAGVGAGAAPSTTQQGGLQRPPAIGGAGPIHAAAGVGAWAAVGGDSAAEPARLFPLEGGLVRTAGLDAGPLAPNSVTGSGMAICRDMLEGIRSGQVRPGWSS